MRFFSILKLSLHSLMNNKLRTLLTIIVISVVSFVIIFLFGIGYSIYKSINLNISNLFQKKGEMINIIAENRGDNHSYSVPLSIEDIETILEKVDVEEGYVSYISFFNCRYGYLIGNNLYAYDYHGNSISVYPFYEKSNPFIGMDNYLVAGRMWNSSDKGSLNVWLDTSFMSDSA